MSYNEHGHKISKYHHIEDEDERAQTKAANKAEKHRYHKAGATATVSHPVTGESIPVGNFKAVQQKDSSDTAYVPTTTNLPGYVDLREHMSSVENQGNVNSCTANALAGCIEYLEKRINDNPIDVSRLFIYYNERNLENCVGSDDGAAMKDGITSLQTIGVCEESIWPYNQAEVSERPSDEAFAEAANRTIESAHRLKTSRACLQGCLADGYPFVFGLQLFESFPQTQDGNISMPDEGVENHLGGHAMCCVGYDNHREVYIVRNSWGPHWADGGYCYVPFAYMEDPKYMCDPYVLLKAHDLDLTHAAQHGYDPNDAEAAATHVSPHHPNHHAHHAHHHGEEEEEQ